MDMSSFDSINTNNIREFTYCIGIKDRVPFEFTTTLAQSFDEARIRLENKTRLLSELAMYREETLRLVIWL